MPPVLDTAITRRRMLGLAGAAAVAAAAAACGGSSSSAKPAAAPSSGALPALAGGRKVTIKTCVYAKNHASSMLYWQKFAPPGVTVSVVPVTNTAEILQGLEVGTLDFGLMSPYVPMLTQVKAGIHSKVIAMVARQGFGLVGKKGVVTSVADLRGKKVAVPPPGAQVLVLGLLLDKAGLVLGKDVTGVPLGYADHVAALARGDVQAFMGSEPPCTQAVVSGDGVRIPGVFDTALGDLNTALWASPSMLKDDELCRVTAQMQKRAAEYLTPAGSNDKTVWHDLLVTQFGFNEQVYTEVLNNVGAQWKFDANRQSQFEAVGKALVDTKALTAQPDYEALYAKQYWNV
ncbi:MAG: ABC transporter substrate-binding protein [Actinomycetota bacterium]|nr:ABC transporter substrate-binding protein [Actinomycetota bacterium]